MKISELMEKLGELQGEHGDLEVCVYTAAGFLVPVVNVEHEPPFGRYSEFVTVKA